jgi:hypothetical protein
MGGGGGAWGCLGGGAGVVVRGGGTNMTFFSQSVRKSRDYTPYFQ